MAPDEVWDRYVRPARWPEWSPQIRDVAFPASSVGPTVLAPGLRGVVRTVLGGRLEFVVDAVDPVGNETHRGDGRRAWAWTVQAARPRVPGARLHLVHEVRPQGEGTCTTLVTTGPALLVLAYAPAALLALRRLVRRRPTGR